MSHEVETMAFAHETPWHGLGRRVDDQIGIDDMLVAAGLNWEVEKLPVTCEGEIVPEHFAIRRATDKTVMDIVGNRWRPVQNREILSFFREWVEAGDATLETAGSLRNGKQIWALANLKTGFTARGGDAVKGYVLLVGSHEAGISTLGRTTAVRVVCANTLAMALQGKSKSEFRIQHSRDFSIQEAKETLGLSREAITEFEKQVRSLQKLKLTRDDAIRVLAPIFQPQTDLKLLLSEEAKLTPSMQQILWAQHKAPGHAGDTGWGLLNGVTYFADHLAKATPDGRFFASQIGHQAAHKEAVHQSLLAMAA